MTSNLGTLWAYRQQLVGALFAVHTFPQSATSLGSFFGAQVDSSGYLNERVPLNAMQAALDSCWQQQQKPKAAVGVKVNKLVNSCSGTRR